MSIDYSQFAIPKVKSLRVEEKRKRRLDDAEAEREARAKVKARDHGRCRVPNCRERAVHLHHVTYRSQLKKKRWDTNNLASLCAGHHALVHAGRIQVSGDADGELVFTGSKADLSFKL